ncbi:MAG: hypothetical protein N2C14_03740, partial [Planctomycetales bacterium]
RGASLDLDGEKQSREADRQPKPDQRPPGGGPHWGVYVILLLFAVIIVLSAILFRPQLIRWLRRSSASAAPDTPSSPKSREEIAPDEPALPRVRDPQSLLAQIGLHRRSATSWLGKDDAEATEHAAKLLRLWRLLGQECEATGAVPEWVASADEGVPELLPLVTAKYSRNAKERGQAVFELLSILKKDGLPSPFWGEMFETIAEHHPEGALAALTAAAAPRFESMKPWPDARRKCEDALRTLLAGEVRTGILPKENAFVDWLRCCELLQPTDRGLVGWSRAAFVESSVELHWDRLADPEPLESLRANLRLYPEPRDASRDASRDEDLVLYQAYAQTLLNHRAASPDFVDRAEKLHRRITVAFQASRVFFPVDAYRSQRVAAMMMRAAELEMVDEDHPVDLLKHAAFNANPKVIDWLALARSRSTSREAEWKALTALATWSKSSAEQRSVGFALDALNEQPGPRRLRLLMVVALGTRSGDSAGRAAALKCFAEFWSACKANEQRSGRLTSEQARSLWERWVSPWERMVRAADPSGNSAGWDAINGAKEYLSERMDPTESGGATADGQQAWPLPGRQA